MTEELLPNSERLVELLGEAKRLAKEYRELTGRPLGITGEVAEYEAARLLEIELSAVRQRIASVVGLDVKDQFCVAELEMRLGKRMIENKNVIRFHG